MPNGKRKQITECGKLISLMSGDDGARMREKQCKRAGSLSNLLLVSKEGVV